MYVSCFIPIVYEFRLPSLKTMALPNSYNNLLLGTSKNILFLLHHFRKCRIVRYCVFENADFSKLPNEQGMDLSDELSFIERLKCEIMALFA
jgi:hypothetical protein